MEEKMNTETLMQMLRSLGYISGMAEGASICVEQDHVKRLLIEIRAEIDNIIDSIELSIPKKEDT